MKFKKWESISSGGRQCLVAQFEGAVDHATGPNSTQPRRHGIADVYLMEWINKTLAGEFDLIPIGELERAHAAHPNPAVFGA